MLDYCRRFLVVIAITACLFILFIGGTVGKARDGRGEGKNLKQSLFHGTKGDKDFYEK
ncbi:hypothetical protein [Fictibacillus macauensis]|uniref:hypothetical protein n=1 Tax=Fictibacillus macauensis TaxID=245160 RepID=UPI0002F8FC50|nr:hypothetical protein [Fictibacillus macauensis]